MMQRPSERKRGPAAHGVEAWLAPLVLAITNLALIAALVWFLIAVYPLRHRINVPKQTIPAAMVVAAVLCLLLFVRAVRSFRAVRAGLARRKMPPPPDP